MDSKQSSSKIEVLKQFGLSNEEAEIYLFLLNQGEKTVSEIRRAFQMGNTKALNLITNLKAKNIVEEIHSETGKFIRGVDPSSLKNLLASKKEKVTLLKNEFENVYEKLLELSKIIDKNSKVLNYKGVEGLKQVMWNSSKAKDELRLYEMAEMSEFLDFGFYESVREIYVKNKIRSYELANESDMPSWTNISEYIKNWEARYIDPKIFQIKFETMIYNDVYALYNKDDNGIFCIEIHNPKLARMQKQLFDFIFKRAQKMILLDELHGRVRVEE